MSSLQLFVSFATLLATLVTAKDAPLIGSCSRSDPKLNECVIKNVAVAIPKLLHGYPKLGIPEIDPLDIKEILIKQGTDQVGLNLLLTKCKFYGTTDNRFLKSRTDLKKRHIEWDMANDKSYYLISDYKASGKILLLPITGTGKSNITISGLKSVLKFDYDLVTKKGKEYIHVTKVSLSNTVSKSYYRLDNLFNGDKLLGENMNIFLNENSDELTKQFEPVISKALSQLYEKILTALYSQAPYDELFTK